jgi:hypothetical protein
MERKTLRFNQYNQALLALAVQLFEKQVQRGYCFTKR